jgi:hypothetical protein
MKRCDANRDGLYTRRELEELVSFLKQMKANFDLIDTNK